MPWEAATEGWLEEKTEMERDYEDGEQKRRAAVCRGKCEIYSE